MIRHQPCRLRQGETDVPTHRPIAPILLSLALLLVCLIGWPAAAPAQTPQSLSTSPLIIETQTGRQFTFTVQVAETPEQHSRGLMFVREMPADAGMLFVYPTAQPRGFWMANTLIPLDMIFIDADGRIINIAERTEPLSLRTWGSEGPAQAVLELNGGITRFLGIRPGDRVIHPRIGG